MNVNELNKEEVSQILSLFDKIKKEKLERERKFGKVKSIVHTDHKNKKFLAVGSTLYFSEKWKTFPDFLFEFVWRIFGKDWYDTESAKNISDQNEIVKWFNKSLEFSETQMPNKNGLIVANPNGFTSAYILFAYDLFTVLNNNFNIDSLIKRLKNKIQFQGARYELFCLAACIRGGFNITLENERDSSRKHVEFKITDPDTNLTFSVEAKSKHRSGMLGQPGDIIPDEKIRVGKITQLINNAVAKEKKHPLIIFLEFNLPPQFADFVIGGKSWNKILKIFDSVNKTDDGKDYFNLVILTNHPHHYGSDDLPDPERIYSLVYSLNPEHVISNDQSFNKVVYAALQYGRVPNDFDEI